MTEDLLAKIVIEDKLITIKDARMCFDGCIPGWKAFAETHGFVWVDVVRHGLYASQLAATNDAMAEQLIRSVYELR